MSTADKNAKKLGFTNYQDYLQSDLGRKIKAHAFKRDQGKCRICGEKAKKLHYKNYALVVLRGYRLGPLVPLCEACYTLIRATKDTPNRCLRRYLRKIAMWCNLCKREFLGVKLTKKCTFCSSSNIDQRLNFRKCAVCSGKNVGKGPRCAKCVR